MNYFELFSLPLSPTVDKASLGSKYFELQKQYHPDHFLQEAEGVQEIALEKSAAVNKAYSIFQDKDKTLEYFLQVSGFLEENEKYELPNEFLMEMMDINELLMEAEPGEIKKQVEKFETEMNTIIQPILNRHADDTIYEDDLRQLKEYHFKKKYLQRILDRLAD